MPPELVVGAARRARPGRRAAPARTPAPGRTRSARARRRARAGRSGRRGRRRSAPRSRRRARSPPAPGGDGQVRSISSSSQASDALGVERAAAHLGGALARQVGRDHAVRRHEVGDHPQPVGRVRARAVQQHQRRAVAALEHARSRRRPAPAVAPRPGVPASRRSRVSRRCRACHRALVLRSSPCARLCGARRAAGIARNHPTSRARAAWVVPPTAGAQRSSCSYA